LADAEKLKRAVEAAGDSSGLPMCGSLDEVEKNYGSRVRLVGIFSFEDPSKKDDGRRKGRERSPNSNSRTKQ